MVTPSIEKVFGLKRWQILLRLPTNFDDTRTYIASPASIAHEEVGVIYGTTHSITQAWHGAPCIKGTMLLENGEVYSFSHFDKLESEYGAELLANIDKPRYYLCQFKRVGQKVFINRPVAIQHEQCNRLIPVYKPTPKALKGWKYQEILAQHIEQLVPHTAKLLREKLSNLNFENGQIRRLLQAQKMTLEQVLLQAHFPSDLESAHEAHQILERIAIVLIFVGTNSHNEHITPNIQLPSPTTLDQTRIPFTLTDEQNDAATGIIDAIRNGKPKSVLFGDVGTGKTVVGGLAAQQVVAAGGRVCVMVPSLILGAQIYKEIDQYWPDSKVVFLLSKSEHEAFEEKGFRCIEELTDGDECNWVVGTTALLHHHNNVEIDLLWVDEEQRVGVDQKEHALITCGRTHLLLSSATCIPRTQAKMTFGLIPYYALTRYHTKRQVDTRLFDHRQASEVINTVQDYLDSGQKVLLICTKKSASFNDNQDRENAEELYAQWREHYGEKVQMAHSGQTKEENERAIQQMKTGQGQLLVATTIIEVGLTIAGLTLVVILNPENLGIVSLHQIRGRVGRKGEKSQCLLLPQKQLKAQSLARLNLLVRYSDGFVLAEEDMKLRGIGDLKGGVNQSGESNCILVKRKLDFTNIQRTYAELEKMSLKDNQGH